MKTIKLKRTIDTGSIVIPSGTELRVSKENTGYFKGQKIDASLIPARAIASEAINDSDYQKSTTCAEKIQETLGKDREYKSISLGTIMSFFNEMKQEDGSKFKPEKYTAKDFIAWYEGD